MLGFSTAGGDGWLAAGEPFPSFAAYGSGNLGHVRLWRVGADGRYNEFETINPVFGLSGAAFGASVTVASKEGAQPTRLALGAPEASRIRPDGSTLSNVGYVCIYSCNSDGLWSREARLDAPVTQSNLYFGAWVSIRGNTLIASMDGTSAKAPNAGARAIYRRGGAGWVFLQMLEAPTPAAGDAFSDPAETSGNWIAAAASEDNRQEFNAGAVHLYHEEGAQFQHRQTMDAPVPEADSLFGERLLLKGSWLFVSSFRDQGGRGAVHVYRLSNGIWNFHQTLDLPFAEAGSFFGVGLSAFGDVLAVSAPGILLGTQDGEPPLDAWRGITPFLTGRGFLEMVAPSHGMSGSFTWQKSPVFLPSTASRRLDRRIHSGFQPASAMAGSSSRRAAVSPSLASFVVRSLQGRVRQFISGSGAAREGKW